MILDGSYRAQDTSLFLRLSQNVPLHISYTSRHPMDSMAETFFQILSQWVPRWKSIVYTGWDLPPTLREELQREDCSPTDLALNIRFPLGQVPDHVEVIGSSAFEKVVLAGATLNWGSPRLSGLRKLHLTNMAGPFRPRESDLFKIISASPQLRDLSLQRLDAGDGLDSSDEEKSVPSVIFESLESLQVICPPLRFPAFLLLSTYPPQLDRVDIGTIPSALFSHPNTSLLASIFQVLRAFSELIVTISPPLSEVAIELPPLAGHILSECRLTCLVTDFISSFTFLGELPNPPTVYLDFVTSRRVAFNCLGVATPIHPRTIFLELLRIFPSITHINVGSFFERMVLDILATPDLSSGVARWGCPELKHLNLGDYADSGPIQDFVRRRWGTCQSMEGYSEDGVPRPTTLESLVCGFSMETTQAENHAMGLCSCSSTT